MADTAVPLIPNAVLWLAKDLGFYDQEGLDLDVVELSGTPLAAAALVSGQADVANLDTGSVINLVATGKVDLRAIHSPNDRQYFVLAARAAVGTPRDLVGKAFGVARRGSVDHAQSQILLRALGLDPASDVQYIGIGEPSNRAKALVADNVQASTFSVATWQSIRGDRSVHLLVDSEAFFQAVPMIAKVNAAPVEVVQQQPAALERFTRAVMLAARHLAANEQAWVSTMMARRSDLSRTDLEQLWQAYRGGWAVNGRLNLDQYARTASFLYQTGALPDTPEIPVERWTTTQFVDQALAEIGLYPGVDDPGRPIAVAAR